MAAVLELRLTGGLNNTDHNVSLGGIASTTVIPSTGKNSVFSDVISSDRVAGSINYMAVALFNSGDVDAVSTIIYVNPTTPSANTQLDIGVELNSTQTVVDNTVEPVGVVFAHHDVISKLAVGVIAPGEEKRIWLKRIVSTNAEVIQLDTCAIVVEFA